MTDSHILPDIRQSLGLRPVINVSGTMTALGASIVVPEAIAAMTCDTPAICRDQRSARKMAAR